MSDDPTPDAPATIELGEDEIEALKFDERQRRPAQKPKRLPSTVEAVDRDGAPGSAAESDRRMDHLVGR